MSDPLPLPQPGERLGWVIYFGSRLELCCFVGARHHDLAYAERRAVELRGVIVEAHAPTDSAVSSEAAAPQG